MQIISIRCKGVGRQQVDKITKTETAQTSSDLYKVCDDLLNPEQKSVLPSHDYIEDSAHALITYFNDKITNFRKDLEKSADSNITNSTGYF